MKLSIVIPAHNEEERLKVMLAPYLAFFAPRYGDEVELIVVVNGSTDRTDRVAQEFIRQYPQLRVLVDPAHIGKGGAIMLGARAARGDLIGFVDADGATPPEAFQDLVDRIGGAGAIIASRWLPGAQVSPAQPPARRIASRLFNLLVRLLFKVRIHDTQCGAKLVRREYMLAALPNIGITRWAFDVDLLFQLRRAGAQIVETPTVWRDVSGSRVRIVRSSLEMFVAMVRLRLIYSPLRWIVTLYDHTLSHIIHPDRYA